MATGRKRGMMTDKNNKISKGIGAMIYLTLALNEHKMNEEQKAKAQEYKDEIEDLMNRENR